MIPIATIMSQPTPFRSLPLVHPAGEPQLFLDRAGVPASSVRAAPDRQGRAATAAGRAGRKGDAVPKLRALDLQPARPPE
jgi:hypothetical protein